jgi:hypothetical protein
VRPIFDGKDGFGIIVYVHKPTGDQEDTAMSPKTFVMEVLSALPDDASLDDCLAEVHLAQALWESLQAGERGEVVSHAVAMARFRERLAAAQVISQG